MLLAFYFEYVNIFHYHLKVMQMPTACMFSLKKSYNLAIFIPSQASPFNDILQKLLTVTQLILHIH